MINFSLKQLSPGEKPRKARSDIKETLTNPSEREKSPASILKNTITSNNSLSKLGEKEEKRNRGVSFARDVLRKDKVKENETSIQEIVMINEEIKEKKPQKTEKNANLLNPEDLLRVMNEKCNEILKKKESDSKKKKKSEANEEKPAKNEKKSEKTEKNDKKNEKISEKIKSDEKIRENNEKTNEKSSVSPETLRKKEKRAKLSEKIAKNEKTDDNTEKTNEKTENTEKFPNKIGADANKPPEIANIPVEIGEESLENEKKRIL